MVGGKKRSCRNTELVGPPGRVVTGWDVALHCYVGWQWPPHGTLLNPLGSVIAGSDLVSSMSLGLLFGYQACYCSPGCWGPANVCVWSSHAQRPAVPGQQWATWLICPLAPQPLCLFLRGGTWPAPPQSPRLWKMQIWGIWLVRGVVYGTQLTGHEGQWLVEGVKEEKAPAWPCEVLVGKGHLPGRLHSSGLWGILQNRNISVKEIAALAAWRAVPGLEQGRNISVLLWYITIYLLRLKLSTLKCLAAELHVSAGKRQSCPVITWQWIMY